ncbi:MAG: phosphoribosylformylglycinamidine synthase [Gammaproteobacteria bacterium]|nr:phosphoribosylformylglycinamidine synthase [Gammaproteobacteria bacterium]MBU1722769.1 phosphoribosylformylglycinamidine synthase [Gammaproteobacteria bacterium]MBU2005204.1 phosphoribosylformylglycinamidine synthase [Gammaproteobacteria bacterium]
MLILPGSVALSDFRRNKLLSALRAAVPAVTGLQAEYTHFVRTSRELSAEEQARLQTLLTYEERQGSHDFSGTLFLVTPRPGTISPWSSKASDIAHNCGLTMVERIERGIAYDVQSVSTLSDAQRGQIAALLHDRMTEMVLADMQDAVVLFSEAEPASLRYVDISNDAAAALAKANSEWGLALSPDEIDYLAENYAELGRNPTDVELMMFAQANSEHCRHKIFNADWIIDGQEQPKSLFGMIRNTYQHAPEGILSAYKDNASVIEGPLATRFLTDVNTGEYHYTNEPVHILMKVETHNHPTAISPFPGAATGSGGEIRDEGATGNGSKPKAGLCGFSVSNLRIPGYEQPWEHDFGKPGRIVSALDIMLEGPIGAAAFNNEFGRPNITGYFRTFEMQAPGARGIELRGYHKPIMLAGGVGNIREGNIEKNPLPEGTPIVVLGGPVMLIGLGGGAASSMASGTSAENLDFASVQRGNPEMQRRCQEVIDRCVALGADNPILSIHDVGAGGISNAIPEIINDAGRGGRIELRTVPNDEPGMSPMEIWSNESQERYVLAIAEERLDTFRALCERERAIYAVVGTATEEQQLLVGDSLFDNNPVDLPMNVLLGKPPKMLRDVHHQTFHKPEIDLSGIDVADAIERVLRLPTVASKSFLITIGDRSVTGMVVRDQMVGPWQVPVADVAVTSTDYTSNFGEAMALGERTPIALVNPAASGRMAIGEALTNIAAADIADLRNIRLSANWMAAAGYPGEDAALFDTVKAVGEDLCPRLGLAIPVGKDSLSMKTVWQQDGEEREMAAPLSLIVSAFAPVQDIRKTLTPQLHTDKGDTDLILVDLGKGKNRLAASALAQVYGQVGHYPPDLDNPDAFRAFFDTIQDLRDENLILAYHDRSDGGLLATLAEMSFAGHVGITACIGELAGQLLPALFSEELGAVLQVRHCDTDTVLEVFREAGLGHYTHVFGELNDTDELVLSFGHAEVYRAPRAALQKIWAETSCRMQALRDNADCAAQEFERLDDAADPGLPFDLKFDPDEDVAAPYINTGVRPAMAILREQGVNGQVEMAAAFDRAGFKTIDVHMTDIISGRVSLKDFKGLVACGGFSYGDVLGAGGGWAKTILMNPKASDEFAAFFAREDSFGLGVCNGCQMFSQLRDMIPGATHWPRFYRNRSEQFEARYSAVEVLKSPSLFLQGMEGSRMPIAVAHGEGRAVFDADVAPGSVLAEGLVGLRYVDNYGNATEHYPENPNGSPLGITGLTTADGRFTIMMPHPERLFRAVQHSWRPDELVEDGAWLRMFRNARVWVG